MVSTQLFFTLAAVAVSWKQIAATSGSSSLSYKMSGSSTAESSVKGPDGIKTGQCAYSDLSGHHIEIKYKETPDGVVTAESDSEYVSDANEALKSCQNAVSKAQEELERNFEVHQKAFDKQQEEFDAKMDDFNKQVGDGSGANWYHGDGKVMVVCVILLYTWMARLTAF